MPAANMVGPGGATAPSSAQASKRGRNDEPAEESGDVVFTALHRSRMFAWNPSPVVALAACPGSPMLAVGYESGDLELWDLAIMACIQRVVGEGIEVTSVAWARDTISQHWRTFAAHLDGTISEVNWAQAALVGTLDTAGGVAWSLASQPVDTVKPGFPHLLAAACDDGAVRLFGVEGGEPGLQMERTLAILHGRLLSCAWHPTGEVMAVGGVEGTVHVLDAVGGHELVRITVASNSSAPAPCVWRLLLLPDGTLVTGDSEGAVQLWDASFGTLIQRFQRHKADVMALAAAPDGSAIFASGVDSQVALFEPVPEGAQGSAGVAGGWAYVDNKRPHTHDVRAMEVVTVSDGRSVLVSGGMDAQLVAYVVESFLERHPVRLSKAPQRPQCQLAPAALAVGGAGPQRRQQAGAAAASVGAAQPAPRLLSSHNDACDVWQLGRHAPVRNIAGAMWSWREPQSPLPGEGSSVDLHTGPRHLVQIKLGDGARIACSAISPDGSYVALCSSQGAVRLYNLQATAGGSQALAQLQPALSVRRVAVEPAGERAVALLLTQQHLVTVQPSGAVSCYELPQAGSSRRRAQGKGAQQDEEEEEEDEPSARLVGELAAPESRARTLEHARGVRGVAVWRRYQPTYTQATASPDGRVVALAGPGGVSLLPLPAKRDDDEEPGELHVSGKPLRMSADGPISGLAFSPDGRRLAAVVASGQMAVWEVEAMRQLQWCLDHEAATHRCLDKLPGPLIGCCFNPDPKVQQLVVYGPGGFCHFDLTLPPDTVHLDAKRKRTRVAPAKGAEEKQGRNGRAILLPDPCVFASYLSVDSLVVLEKPWEDVARSFAPPLLRQRYGT